MCFGFGSDCFEAELGRNDCEATERQEVDDCAEGSAEGILLLKAAGTMTGSSSLLSDASGSESMSESIWSTSMLMSAYFGVLFLRCTLSAISCFSSDRIRVTLVGLGPKQSDPWLRNPEWKTVTTVCQALTL